MLTGETAESAIHPADDPREQLIDLQSKEREISEEQPPIIFSTNFPYEPNSVCIHIDD